MRRFPTQALAESLLQVVGKQSRHPGPSRHTVAHGNKHRRRHWQHTHLQCQAAILLDAAVVNSHARPDAFVGRLSAPHPINDAGVTAIAGPTTCTFETGSCSGRCRSSPPLLEQESCGFFVEPSSPTRWLRAERIAQDAGRRAPTRAAEEAGTSCIGVGTASASLVHLPQMRVAG